MISVNKKGARRQVGAIHERRIGHRNESRFRHQHIVNRSPGKKMNVSLNPVWTDGEQHSAGVLLNVKVGLGSQLRAKIRDQGDLLHVNDAFIGVQLHRRSAEFERYTGEREYLVAIPKNQKIAETILVRNENAPNDSAL